MLIGLPLNRRWGLGSATPNQSNGDDGNVNGEFTAHYQHNSSSGESGAQSAEVRFGGFGAITGRGCSDWETSSPTAAIFALIQRRGGSAFSGTVAAFLSTWPDEEAAIPLIGCVAGRLGLVDPGFVRTRRGVRAVCATVLAWATMLAVTSVFDVDAPLRITLFAAGAAFEGALLAPDPQTKDRLRTLGWAAVVCGAAVIATVQLTLIAVWVAAVLLVLLMFSSYARSIIGPR
jgi:hypothetical protein